MKMYDDVVKFIEASDQSKTIDNEMLYRVLIDEEYSEWCAATDLRNNVEDLDACMDMIWVILGYCYMKGWDVNGAWNEVARSNHAKIDPTTGKVRKREDGKVLKPDGWTPPELEKYLNK